MSKHNFIWFSWLFPGELLRALTQRLINHHRIFSLSKEVKLRRPHDLNRRAPRIVFPRYMGRIGW